jgi:hypothetical protein
VPVRLFVFSEDQSWAYALERHARRVLRTAVVASLLESPATRDDVLRVFSLVSRVLQRNETSDLLGAVAILDIGLMTAVQENIDVSAAWPGDLVSSVIAMLRLAFPEMVWLTPTSAVDRVHTAAYWLNIPATISQAAANSLDALFDAADTGVGVRRWLGQSRKDRYADGTDNDGQRQEVAVAIDEEEPFVLLHAYLAYRSGYPCRAVATQRRMEELFRDPYIGANAQAACNVLAGDVALTVEDVFLNFPDRRIPRGTGGVELHFSRLADRDEYFPGLLRVPERIFVTVGHRRTDWYARSAAHVIRFVGKPSGGIYGLLNRAGLAGRYWRQRRTAWGRVAASDAEVTGHSAPGRLLVIVNDLLARATRIYKNAWCVRDCIHGAVLMHQAQELLGYNTPTTALEVTLLRHKLEVTAECMFQGMEHTINVKDRLREIRGEVRAVSTWFNPAGRRRAALNAEMSIVTELTRIFRAKGKFDEEQLCLKRLRALNRGRFYTARPGLSFLFPFQWYVETLVGSLPLFITAVVGWPVILGLIGCFFKAEFCGAAEALSTTTRYSSADQITNAVAMFFGGTPMNPPVHAAAHFLYVFSAGLGFLHLGIFVSYLYTLVTRK